MKMVSCTLLLLILPALVLSQEYGEDDGGGYEQPHKNTKFNIGFNLPAMSISLPKLELPQISIKASMKNKKPMVLKLPIIKFNAHASSEEDDYGNNDYGNKGYSGGGGGGAGYSGGGYSGGGGGGAGYSGGGYSSSNQGNSYSGNQGGQQYNPPSTAYMSTGNGISIGVSNSDYGGGNEYYSNQGNQGNYQGNQGNYQGNQGSNNNPYASNGNNPYASNNVQQDTGSYKNGYERPAAGQYGDVSSIEPAYAGSGYVAAPVPVPVPAYTSQSYAQPQIYQPPKNNYQHQQQHPLQQKVYSPPKQYQQQLPPQFIQVGGETVYLANLHPGNKQVNRYRRRTSGPEVENFGGVFLASASQDKYTLVPITQQDIKWKPLI